MSVIGCIRGVPETLGTDFAGPLGAPLPTSDTLNQALIHWWVDVFFLGFFHVGFWKRVGLQLQPAALRASALRRALCTARHCLLFFLVKLKRKYLQWVKHLGHGGAHSPIKSSLPPSGSADPEQPTSADSSAASSEQAQWQTDHRKLLRYASPFCTLLSPSQSSLFAPSKMLIDFDMSRPLVPSSSCPARPHAPRPCCFGTWESVPPPSVKHLATRLLQSDVSSFSFPGVYHEFWLIAV